MQSIPTPLKPPSLLQVLSGVVFFLGLVALVGALFSGTYFVPALAFAFLAGCALSIISYRKDQQEHQNPSLVDAQQMKPFYEAMAAYPELRGDFADTMSYEEARQAADQANAHMYRLAKHKLLDGDWSPATSEEPETSASKKPADHKPLPDFFVRSHTFFFEGATLFLGVALASLGFPSGVSEYAGLSSFSLLIYAVILVLLVVVGLVLWGGSWRIFSLFCLTTVALQVVNMSGLLTLGYVPSVLFAGLGLWLIPKGLAARRTWLAREIESKAYWELYECGKRFENARDLIIHEVSSSSATRLTNAQALNLAKQINAAQRDLPNSTVVARSL